MLGACLPEAQRLSLALDFAIAATSMDPVTVKRYAREGEEFALHNRVFLGLERLATLQDLVITTARKIKVRSSVMACPPLSSALPISLFILELAPVGRGLIAFRTECV
jgi:hypothetical protein